MYIKVMIFFLPHAQVQCPFFGGGDKGTVGMKEDLREVLQNPSDWILESACFFFMLFTHSFMGIVPRLLKTLKYVLNE